MTGWKEIYNPILAHLHAHGLTDYEIHGRMLDDGLRVSYGDVLNARQRLRLKSHTRQAPRAEEVVRLPREKPDPLALAQLYLPGFDRATMTIMESGTRRHISFHDAIKRTNRVMKRMGLPLLTGSPLWTEGL